MRTIIYGKLPPFRKIWWRTIHMSRRKNLRFIILFIEIQDNLYQVITQSLNLECLKVLLYPHKTTLFPQKLHHLFYWCLFIAYAFIEGERSSKRIFLMGLCPQNTPDFNEPWLVRLNWKFLSIEDQKDIFLLAIHWFKKYFTSIYSKRWKGRIHFKTNLYHDSD